MRQGFGAAHAEPFFLKTSPGQRYCLFHPPTGDCCGALIYVHPFGEEMNKARRMAALQARDLAAFGYGVLQLDLYGCGDSSGDFGDARWEIWKDDLSAARQWLEIRLGKPVGLWGLRLGALLALDFARSAPELLAQIVLWQPVHSGPAFLNQFLRLKVANQMLSGTEKNGGTQILRDTLRGGAVLEIAGYTLAPELADAIESLDAAQLGVTAVPVHWFELVASEGRGMSPAGLRITSAWTMGGVDLQIHLVPCQPFWATQEITQCAALLAATSALFSGQKP